MLVAIHHMIRDDKDFLPIDYNKVANRKQFPKELNLKNVIDFLGERGVDANTIRIVEKQCSQDAVDKKAAMTAVDEYEQKKKQPKTITETTAEEQKPAKRRGRRQISHQTKVQPLDQLTVTTV